MLDDLEAALAFSNTALIIRSASIIAEIRGPLAVRRGSDWLTLGEDGGTHVHLRGADVARCRLVQAEAANLMLELHDSAGATLCKVSFRNTNPSKQDRFDPELSARVRARFAHLVSA
jgi:hypothetical protein